MTCALYWDPSLPSSYDGVDGANLPARRTRLSSSPTQLATIATEFDQVWVFTSVRTVARHLFGIRRQAFVDPDDDRSSLRLALFVSAALATDQVHLQDLATVIRLVAFQWSHPAAIVTVFDSAPPLVASFYRLGASVVVEGKLTPSHIVTTTALLQTRIEASQAGPARELTELLDRHCILTHVLGTRVLEPLAYLSAASAPKPSLSSQVPTPLSGCDIALEADPTTVRAIVSSWSFRAHALRGDELVLAAVEMISHALTSAGPDLEPYFVDRDALTTFVLVIRDCYRARNHYHNFRHAIDVLQATFHFLIALGTLPPLNSNKPETESETGTKSRKQILNHTLPKPPMYTPRDASKSPLSSVDALALLVVAIGHDVGHPGVTNAFLISAKAPLAKLYNDKSVLESFHSAALCTLLEAHWPALVNDPAIKSTIVESVLATDMALHFDYMERLAVLKDPKSDPARCRSLLCCILIKCADISNVSRPFDISVEWGRVLAKEFSNISILEDEFGLKTATVIPASPNPKPKSITPPPTVKTNSGEWHDLCQGQVYFIDTFALPLFSSVSSTYPELRFAAKIIETNRKTWTSPRPSPNG